MRRLKRRHVVQALTLSAGAPFFAGACARAQSDLASPGLVLTGSLSPVHDPAIIKQDGAYHLFSTSHTGEGDLIHWRVSTDLHHWVERGGVFQDVPAWARAHVPKTRGIWAPDIVSANGERRLYYSVSSFGRNTSAIGLVTTPTLDHTDERFGWRDRGAVFVSNDGDDYNAIDPNIFIDDDGAHWMSFGSFWTGMKMIALDPETGLASENDQTVYALARRPSPGAVEAPFLIKRDGFYYLFASFDFCCRGAASTYHTVVGRAEAVAGPYVDREGQLMMEGGGTRVLHADMDPSGRFAGPGHVAILRDDGADYIVYHAYDTDRDGAPTLRIQPLDWTDDGWPVAV